MKPNCHLWMILLLLPGMLCALGSTPVAASEDDFPYELTLKSDIPLGILGVGTFVTGMVMTTRVPDIHEEDIVDLRKSDINRFDRSAARRWSPASATLSNVTLAVIEVAPALLLLPHIKHKRWNRVLTLAVMYAEAMSINTGVVSIFKSTIQRKRPFLYNDSLSVDTRLDEPGGNLSFYSGHSSSSFCAAVFLSTVFGDLYPESKFRYAMWPITLSLATTTALLRYTAGKHYPSDILTGAAVGGLIGFLVPTLHRKNRLVNMTLYPIVEEYRGVGGVLRF